ncbi:MAG TPA: lysylphosphatidylglycerol synthase domain-containing protein, partial [Gemmatimonadaceae bacterium]|nr:lysylphosphatidylglycerol synthase domain-containing protein [Gemmatimonadaceae bacterium]
MSRKVQLAAFLLGVTAFSLIIHRVGLAGLLRSLQAARSAVLPAVLSWAVVYACSTLAWEQLASDERGPPIPYLRAYAISVASFALNYVTPMVALGGEPFRIAAASDWMPTPRAVSSVVSFRMVHTLGELLFWLTAVPIAFVVLPHRLATTLILCAVVLGLLAVTSLIVAMFRHG